MQQVDKWLEEIVKGKTFTDVGGLWGTENEKVTAAVQAGASEAAMIDITHLGTELWRRFDDRCALKSVSGYKCIQADIDDYDIVAKTGIYDVVHSTGVLYHCPNPLYTVIQLSKICRQTIILGSTVIPQEISNTNGKIILESGSALFSPAMNETQRAVIGQYFKEVGAQAMLGITTSCEWLFNDYGPWWWLFTSEFIAALLKVAGFKILATGSHWEGRIVLYLAEKETRNK